MKLRQFILCLVIIFLFSFFGISCSPIFGLTRTPSTKVVLTSITPNISISITNILATPTTTLSNIPSPSSLITSSSALISTPTLLIPGNTPRPTLDKYSSEKVIGEFIKNNGGCDLPCIWRIVPGKTNLDQGTEILSYLGWKGGLYNNGSTYYSSIRLLDSTNIHFGLYQENQIIRVISFQFTHQQFTLLNQYYSIINLLSHYGTPSQIWINLTTRAEIATPYAGFDIYLFYEDLGILAKYPGVALLQGNQYRLCPTHPYAGAPNSISTEGGIVLYLTETQKVLKPNDLVQPFDEFGAKLTIDKAFQINSEKFTQQLLYPLNGQTCFYTDRSIWQ